MLIACLFWGYLWGLVGLVLAMPITVSLKVVFQAVPELNRWAELMSLDWQSPAATAPQPPTIEESPSASPVVAKDPLDIGPRVDAVETPA